MPVEHLNSSQTSMMLRSCKNSLQLNAVNILGKSSFIDGQLGSKNTSAYAAI